MVVLPLEGKPNMNFNKVFSPFKEILTKNLYQICHIKIIKFKISNKITDGMPKTAEEITVMGFIVINRPVNFLVK